jgi:hypothetical protein
VSINKRLRFAVLERDKFKCRYCNASDVELQVDHVIPKSLGGQDLPENLVTSCCHCNRGKSSVVLGGPRVSNPRRIHSLPDEPHLFKVQKPKHWFGEGEQDQKALFAQSVAQKCKDPIAAERITESTWRRQGERAIEIFAQSHTLTDLITGLGITAQEIEYIARHEDVKTREDLLRRRLPISMARSEQEIADNGPLQDLLDRLGL